jgi:hypothetical protein
LGLDRAWGTLTPGGQLPERAWKRVARDRGIDTRANASHLDVFDWVALFKLVHNTRPG